LCTETEVDCVKEKIFGKKGLEEIGFQPGILAKKWQAIIESVQIRLETTRLL
jgi:hypothetical protein